MGYVPIFCAGCAGPISHGFGLDGALEEMQERDVAEPNAGAPQWRMGLEEMEWLNALRVVTSDKVSGVLEYEDYGILFDGQDSFALNPVSWKTEEATPAVPFHVDCLAVAEEALAGREPAVTTMQLVAAYHDHLVGLWAQQDQKRSVAMEAAAGKLLQSPDPALESLLLNTLIPGVDYGEGITERCVQYYEFKPGAEWLVRSPLAEGDEAGRNRQRIEAVITQLSDILLPQ